MGNSRFVYLGWYGDMVGIFRARPKLGLFCVDMIKPALVTEGHEPGRFALGLQRVCDGSAGDRGPAETKQEARQFAVTAISRDS